MGWHGQGKFSQVMTPIWDIHHYPAFYPHSYEAPSTGSEAYVALKPFMSTDYIRIGKNIVEIPDELRLHGRIHLSE